MTERLPAEAINARQAVLAKHPDAVCVKALFVGDYEIRCSGASHRAPTKEGAWESAAASLDDYHPGAEIGWRQALEWVLGELEDVDRNDRSAILRAFDGLKLLIGAKLAGLDGGE